MQQQDNDFPIDQIQSSTNPPDGGLAGGTTFQPQTNAQPTDGATASGGSAPSPAWQQAAANDASELYQQPATPPVQPAVSATSTPDVNNPPSLVAPDSNQVVTNPGQVPAPMQQDFSQANQIATPTPAPQPMAVEPNSVNIDGQPVAPTTPHEPIVSMPPTAPVDTSAMATSSMLGGEPAAQIPTNPAIGTQTPTSGLPGSDQLGQASLGMDQSSVAQPASLDPNMANIDPLAANMDGMGAYGPPPNSKKKLIFIIGGAILGVVIIGIVIFVITSSSARKPAQNLNPTTTDTAPEQTTPTPTPSSGPATPPQGYVTIDKQCYTFALYDPNTVPADQACSFKEATFGKLQTSKISVTSTTESYKNLDDFEAAIKPTLTVTSEESIKLDNFDAKQLIYKASDGKTYSRVLALIVGKSYQQDGKPVTGIDIITSYQEDFDKTVTKNVLDTWRWK